MAPESTSGGALVGRIFAMLLGPALLLMLAVSIAREGGGWFTAGDAAFLAVLAGMLAGRLAEFRGGNFRTATGAPATPAHLKNYCLQALAAGLALWIAANVIGNSQPG